MHFPVSGVECSPLLLPLVSFVVSSLTASAGVSGAFLLLPFQVSVLGFTSPAVSPTNLIYNIVATPGGVYRYWKERRMAWPIAWAIIAGTVPGVFAGTLVRIRFLPDARSFKVFAGCVLMALGIRLLYQVVRPAGKTWRQPLARTGPAASLKTRSLSVGRVEFDFREETFSFSPKKLVLLGLAVGLIGGIYGIGGGAIIAPFLVSVMGLPVYAVAGACLLGTLVASVSGVASFQLLGFTAIGAGASVHPDWALGALFGIGGLFGTYAGARLQKFLPERLIRLFLGVLVGGVALGYIGQYFLK